MFIAAMTNSPDRKGIIAPRFALAEYLLIFDTETTQLSASYERGKLSDVDLSEKIVEHGCEAVICGPIEEAPFAVIADEGCVTRYRGSGLELDDAILKMEAYELPLITDFIGGTGCGSGEGAECDRRHGQEDA